MSDNSDTPKSVKVSKSAKPKVSRKRKKLTPKQAVYVQAILDGSSKSDAAREAYPDAIHPNIQGYKVLQNDLVRQALLDRLHQGNHIDKVSNYLDSVMNDEASKS